MSGRTKRILYSAFDWGLLILSLAAVALTIIFCVPYRFTWREWVAGAFLPLCLALRVPSAVHEIGHLCFGLAAGMKPVAVTLSYFRISPSGVRFVYGDVAGATEMFPHSGTHIKARAIAYTVGGSALCLLFSVFPIVFFLLPYHAALLFFACLSFFVVTEGIRAMIPAELPAGKTDGAVLYGILAGRPDEDVALRVMTAQGILYRGSFSDVPKELFAAPVVREDLPARHALGLLYAQFCFSRRDEAGAKKQLCRLKEIGEELSSETAEEVERYLGWFEGTFEPRPCPLHGVNELEQSLAESRHEKIPPEKAE